MKAIVVHEFGAPEVLKLEDLPTPKPGSGQVVVRIRAAGVNPFDTYMRAGTYAIKPPLPYVPGGEGAGVVDAWRGRDEIQAGRPRVCGASLYRHVRGVHAGARIAVAPTARAYHF